MVCCKEEIDGSSKERQQSQRFYNPITSTTKNSHESSKMTNQKLQKFWWFSPLPWLNYYEL